MRQLLTKIVVKPATTAPNKPIDATIVVPIPRSSFFIDSLTKVIPAPNSPANPKPEMKRNIEYQYVSLTNPFKIFAIEYTIMLPNKTDKRPFLSPKIPQKIPPTIMPII